MIRSVINRIAVVLAAAVSLAGGAAVAADVHSPSLTAPPALAGYGEVSFGWVNSDFATDPLFALGGGAYLNTPVNSVWNLQVEARGVGASGSLGSTVGELGAFAHLYWRDPARYSIGGFAGFTRLELYGMHGNMVTGGAEAQGYWGPLTLYGQAAAYSSTSDGVGWLYFNGYFLRGAARYFATPNLRLQLDAQWGVIDNSDHTAALTLMGTAEYRFMRAPLSAFGQLRWDQMTPDLNRPGNTTTVLFGLRAYYGSGTLIDNDRHGAPMDVLTFPPTFALNFG